MYGTGNADDVNRSPPIAHVVEVTELVVDQRVVVVVAALQLVFVTDPLGPLVPLVAPAFLAPAEPPGGRGWKTQKKKKK